MVNSENTQSEKQEKSGLLKDLYLALKKMLLESLKNRLSKDAYSSNGVLGKKFDTAQSVYNEARRERDVDKKTRLYERAAWLLIELKQDKEGFVKSREEIGSDANTKKVDESLHKAAESSHLGWSQHDKETVVKTNQQRNLEVSKTALKATPTPELVKQHHGESSISDLQARKSSQRRRAGELMADTENEDTRFEKKVDTLLDEIQTESNAEGIKLSVFVQNEEQKQLIEDIEKRNEFLEGLGEGNVGAAAVLEHMVKKFAESGHLLPVAERQRIAALLQAQERRFARSIAETRAATRGPRYMPPETADDYQAMESRHRDLANRLRSGEITNEQYRLLQRDLEPGDQQAYSRFQRESGSWLRGGNEYDDLPFLPDPDDPNLPPELMGNRRRDPNVMYGELMRKIDTNYRGISKDTKLFKQVVNDYVMKILQSEASSRQDWNLMTLKSELDLLLRSSESIAQFEGMTDKFRDDTRDQIGMVMTFFEAGLAAGSINMEQWVGMWKSIPTEGYADMLTFAHKLTVEYRNRDGTIGVPQEIELKMGDMVDYLDNEVLAGMVLDRDFNTRRYGMELLAMYAVASQLPGWKDIKTRAGTTDFSQLRFRKNDAGDGYLVWMGSESNAVEIVGMQNPLTGNHEMGAEQLKNYASSMAKFVVNLEKHVTLKLTKYNHNYTGDFNDQTYKHVGNAYARKFGIPLYFVLFEAMDPMKRDPVSETYFKQNREAIATLAKANGLFKKDEHGKFVLNKRGEKIVDPKAVGELITMLQFLTTDREGYHMSKERQLSNFDRLFISRKTINSYGEEESRLERLPFDKREEMKKLLAKYLDNPEFNWQSLIFHHLGLDTNDNNWEERAMKRMKVASRAEMPGWMSSFKGHNGFRAFVQVETSSMVYSNKTMELQKEGLDWRELAHDTDLSKLDEGAFAHDMAKQAGYLGESVAAKAAIMKLAIKYDPEGFVKFVESNGEGAYNYMNREQREWKYIQILLAKDKVFRRQATNIMYEVDRNNSLQFVRISEEGTPIFKSVKKRFYHQGYERGAGIEPPWMSKWLIDKLWGIGAIYNKNRKEFIYGQSIETFAGMNLSKLTFHPFGWVKNVPVVGKYLEGLVPYDTRWGPGPMLNWMRRKWRVVEKRKLVGDVFSDWMTIVMGEVKKIDGLN